MKQLLPFALVALTAIHSFAQEKEPGKQLDKLIPQLKDGDIKARMAAAIAIGNLGETAKKRAIPALRDVLLNTKEDFNVHNHAIVAIQKMGADSHPVLVKCARDGSTFVRRVSVGALAGVGKEAVPTLIKALTDPDRNVRRIAIRSLGRIGPNAKSALPALKAATRDANGYVATTAARTLWQIAGGGGEKLAKAKAAHGLAAFIHSSQTTFKVGQPIPMRYGVMFKGGSQQNSVRIWRPMVAVDPNNGSWFEVTGPDGQPLKYQGIFVSWAHPKPSKDNPLLLHAGEFTGRDDSDLTMAFNLTQPGKYKVRWVYQPFGGSEGIWRGKIHSNELSFTIRELNDIN